MNLVEEMTTEQLEQGLVRANEQLQAFLSRQTSANNSSFIAEKFRQPRDTANILAASVKLQNTVRRIETEIRSRQGGSDSLSERFEVELSLEQKQWVINSGGAVKIRELIDQARQ